MILTEIKNKKTGEVLIKAQQEDFEYQNPIEYYKGEIILNQMINYGISPDIINNNEELSDKDTELFNKAVEFWIKYKRKFDNINIPNELIKLLLSKKKAIQKDLLQGMVLTPNILTAFIFKAYEKYGYTLSQYTSEFNQKNIDLSKMPFAYRVKDNGEVEVIGETELSDGQLKQALEHRSVKIAKFLDKGNDWHCFFITFQSIGGRETWLGKKQPHYHYISNHFGIKREKVIEQLKSRKYKLGNLPHIKLIEYGNQPE
ncbi:hypothetical protein [uncultured Algibacter sp.]|uniref:hypothetical protein n=1 Tax=uncultured Algibacter sp. TaxID=298659 RepID=UPI003217BD83